MEPQGAYRGLGGISGGILPKQRNVALWTRTENGLSVSDRGVKMGIVATGKRTAYIFCQVQM